MSDPSRRRFQRIALLLIGSLLVVIGARQLAYAAGNLRCKADRRLGYYEDHRERRHHVRHHREQRHREMEMHVFVN